MVVMLDVVVVIIISLSPPSLYKPRNTQFRCGSSKLRINVTVHQDFVYQIYTFQSTGMWATHQPRCSCKGTGLQDWSRDPCSR